MTSSLLLVYSIILLILCSAAENTSEVNALHSLSKPSDQAVSKLVDGHLPANVCLKPIKLSQNQMNTRNQLLQE